MSYTDADQRADTAFLVGVRYGREAERARMIERCRCGTCKVGAIAAESAEEQYRDRELPA